MDDQQPAGISSRRKYARGAWRAGVVTFGPLCASLLVACATARPLGVLDPTHPGSADAVEAAMPEPGTTLGRPGGDTDAGEAAARPSHGPGMHGSEVIPQRREPMYVCPMHSDVRRSEPGKCPKCGMTLVKEESEARTPEGRYAH